MNDTLRDFSTPAVERAIEHNLFALMSLFMGKLPQAEVHDEPEMLWTITSLPISLFNSVLRAQLLPATVDAALETVIARGQSRNVPLMWWTGPATRPADLGASLEAHGFTRVDDQPGMAVDIPSLPESIPAPPGLTIEQVQDIDTLKKWHRVFAVGFSLSDPAAEAFYSIFEGIGFGTGLPVYSYLGRLEGEPVATVFLFLAAGVAGIYGVATVPEARRKGIASAMTFQALAEGRCRGYRVGILQASEMGASVYRKLGFREYCKIGQYLWKPGPAGQGWAKRDWSRYG